jgi:hypothetical protein
LVKLDEFVVLGETIFDEVCLDCPQEVPVEGSIDQEVENLLGAVPVLVDEVVSRADLETSRDPNAEDADVDHRNEDSCQDHDVS